MIIGVDARPLNKKTLTGIGTYLYRVLQEIQIIESKRQNPNHYILFSNKPYTFVDGLDDNIFEKVVIPFKIGPLWPTLKLKSALKKYSVDVFWGSQNMLPPKVKGIRYILTIHDLVLVINPAWGSVIPRIETIFFFKDSVRRADKIITISEATKKDVINLLKYDAARIVIVYNGADVPDSKTDECFLKNKYGISGNYFLYLGTIEPRKNISTIIRAYELYRERNKDSKELLVLAGGLGWKYKPILEKIESSKYREDIIQTGYIDNSEKNAFYKNARAFIFPSEYEGFGIPILEAMNQGTPVITARNSSLPEVAGEVGFYVEDCKDYKGITALMENIVSLNDNEKELLSCKAKEWAGIFTWKRCAINILEVLEEDVSQESH